MYVLMDWNKNIGLYVEHNAIINIKRTLTHIAVNV
jgi:hypothetical protein